MANKIIITFIDGTEKVFTSEHTYHPNDDYIVSYEPGVVIITDKYGNTHSYPTANVREVQDYNPSRSPRRY